MSTWPLHRLSGRASTRRSDSRPHPFSTPSLTPATWDARPARASTTTKAADPPRLPGNRVPEACPTEYSCAGGWVAGLTAETGQPRQHAVLGVERVLPDDLAVGVLDRSDNDRVKAVVAVLDVTGLPRREIVRVYVVGRCLDDIGDHRI